MPEVSERKISRLGQAVLQAWDTLIFVGEMERGADNPYRESTNGLIEKGLYPAPLFDSRIGYKGMGLVAADNLGAQVEWLCEPQRLCIDMPSATYDAQALRDALQGGKLEGYPRVSMRTDAPRAGENLRLRLTHTDDWLGEGEVCSIVWTRGSCLLEFAPMPFAKTMASYLLSDRFVREGAPRYTMAATQHQ